MIIVNIFMAADPHAFQFDRSLEITLRIERKKDKINNSVEIYHIFNWTRRKRGEVQ